MKRSVAAALFLGIIPLLTACSQGGTPNQGSSSSLTATPPERATATGAPPSPTPDMGEPRMEVLAHGLEVPWALDLAPDGRIFFTERPGRVRVIQDGKLRPEPVAQLPVAHVGEGGLLGLALDPRFQDNHYVYVYYTYRQGTRLMNRVVRLTEENGRGANPQTLLDGVPGASIHDGGRLRFGPDGKLYITTGDAAMPDLAQDVSSLAGKILRVNPDGSVPVDNPFPGSPVYSFGHRNPQGLSWHPLTGMLFATEHGPVGNDEVNIIQAGKNYGWPTAQGYGGNPDYVDPVLVFNPAVAPSGGAFLKGKGLPAWQGHLFFATLRGEQLARVALERPDYSRVAGVEQMFKGRYGRLRDVVEGPDGSLYILTSNRDGRGTPVPQDDRILRLLPFP